MSKVVRASIPHRNYPGDFKGYPILKKDIDGTSKAVLKHEIYHVNLQYKKTKEIIGGFTTHPKPNQPNYYKISDQKLDGDAGEQYFGVYNNPKIIRGNTKIIRELPEIQPFIDKHECVLHKIEASKKQAFMKNVQPNKILVFIMKMVPG